MSTPHPVLNGTRRQEDSEIAEQLAPPREGWLFRSYWGLGLLSLLFALFVFTSRPRFHSPYAGTLGCCVGIHVWVCVLALPSVVSEAARYAASARRGDREYESPRAQCTPGDRVQLVFDCRPGEIGGNEEQRESNPVGVAGVVA
jgi:hypothetical protein